jgi:hypothetical protein
MIYPSKSLVVLLNLALVGIYVHICATAASHIVIGLHFNISSNST